MSALRYRARRDTRLPSSGPRTAAARSRRGAAHTAEPLEPRRLLAVFTVTTVQDDVIDPDDGKLTLREAILASENNPGADTIRFAIPGDGVNGIHVIDMSGRLLEITDTLTIDGFTQLGAQPNNLPEGNNALIKVEIRGRPEFDGLVFRPGAEGSEVRGLSVRGFAFGIVAHADNVKISGVSITGNFAGISVWSGGVHIGGPDPADRTVVSGNEAGISLTPASRGATVRGTYVGTDSSGKDRAGTQRTGIRAAGRGHELGGQGVGDRLIISGNEYGVIVGNDDDPESATRDIVISGCFIGSGNDYTAPGNDFGVFVVEGDNILIGDEDDPLRGNHFSHNQRGAYEALDGVELEEDVTFRLNSASNNGGPPPPGPSGGGITPAGDPAGAMLPTLTSASTTPAGTAVSGSISNAVPGSMVAVDIHASHEQGESEVFLETINVKAGPDGNATFNAIILASGMRYVTAYATASGGRGGTSALSNTVENARPPVLTVTNTSGSLTVAGSYPFVLRQASMTPGPEVIEFAIPNLTAPAQIAAVLIVFPPPPPLPLVIELKDLIIDGTTQGGGGLVPRIYITGTGSDLHAVVSGVTIFGLGFANARGIDLEGSPFGGDGFNRVSRNYLGVNPAGQPVGLPPFDSRAMVRIFGDRNRIDHNIIHSGRGSSGIWSFGGSHNRIDSNRIGINLEGRALADNHYGIRFSDDVVSGPSDNNVIVDNTIGYTQFAAVAIEIGTGNRIERNTMIENAGLGIELGDDGPTPNDPLDADVGPNGLQNFPVLSSAVPAAGGTRVTGALNSRPQAPFQLDFYAVAIQPAAGADEGRRWLGSAPAVTTDANGDAPFDVIVAGAAAPGERVIATATDAAGSTSEFSATVVVSIPVTPAARRAFYNNSALDAGAAGDDGAIALDKSALLPGQRATFANVTNYSRGVNGVMVDLPPLGRTRRRPRATSRFTSATARRGPKGPRRACLSAAAREAPAPTGSR